MKNKKFPFTLFCFLFFIHVNISAQSFLKKLADGIEKVNKQVENVNQAINDITNTPTTESNQSEQVQEQEQQQASQSETNTAVAVSVAKLPTSQQKTDWEKRNLKGNVNTITLKVESSNQGAFTINYAFTTTGMLQHIIHKNANGVIIGKIEYTYDTSGKLTKKVVDTKDGIPYESLSYYKSSETFKYNATTGRLTESYDAINKYKTLYSYDAKGLKTKESYVFDNRAESEPREFYYDEKGNLTSVLSRGSDSYAYDMNNNLIEMCGDGYCSQYKYNEYGDSIEEVDLDYEDTVSKKTSTYQYDNQNNWISKSEKVSGQFINATSKVTRQIVYY